MSFTRLVRFLPDGGEGTPLIGQPVDGTQDVGLATYDEKAVEVDVYSGDSVLRPGRSTARTARIHRLLSPLAAHEVGTIRCVGLNYRSHAKEVNLPLPTVPTLFMKPSSALGDPFPAATVLPRAFKHDEAADYEAEVAVVIGTACKDVSEADAMQHVLGITAANDVSSRKAQFEQSQWCYSKSFDGACPLGPALVSLRGVEVGKVRIQGSLGGDVVQDSTLDDLIFGIPALVAFLSRGTTLPAGTIILTGTPAGIGWSRDPKRGLRHDDEFRVTVSHGVGTLINRIQDESP